MIDYSDNGVLDRRRTTTRTTTRGCGLVAGIVAGIVIGALLMLAGLVAFAPHPRAASPGAGGNAGDIGVTVDDVYLTHVIDDAVSSASLPIALSNVQAEILPNDQVMISGHASGPLTATTQLVATSQLRVQSGQLALHILSAQVGGLPLPASIISALEQPINTKLASATRDLLPSGFVITGVSTTEHHLQMTITQR